MLNHRITKSEVKKAIKKLNIINEVLKTGEFCLVDHIVKLLNLILQSEKYPLKWTRNLLVTLHKGGPLDEPDNYRGKSISSCLSKLFSTVLYLRILEVNANFSLISNNQIGFLKGYRTAYHVLFIDTVFNEIVHRQRKRLFVAFVDLKKAYDKVNRKFTISKLRNKGFSGKFLKIFEAMLNSVTQIPKINGYFLSPILTTQGLVLVQYYLISSLMTLKIYLMRTVILYHYQMICPLITYSMQMIWPYFHCLVRAFNTH